LDRLIADQVLEAIKPSTLELAVAASAEVQKERDRLAGHWQQRLERARYEVQRAERQYAAVEPENRLVARELERRWEQTPLEERTLQEEHDRFLKGQSGRLQPQ
jgi:uncharacterized protein YndB with AHSA1/START domain